MKSKIPLILALLLLFLPAKSQNPCGVDCNICGLYMIFLFCIECNPNRQVNSTTGLCDCATGYYESTTNLCEICPFPCKTCSLDTNHIDCTECEENANRVHNSTDCRCIDGYVDTGNTICSFIQPLQEEMNEQNIFAIIAGSVSSLICCFGVMICLCIIRKRNSYKIHYQPRIQPRLRRNIHVNQQTNNHQSVSESAEQTQCGLEKNKFYEFKTNETCSICLDQKTFFMTECGHYFHSKCIYSWLKSKKVCPNCNQETNSKKILKWCLKCYRNVITGKDPSIHCDGCLDCEEVIIIN